MSIKGLHEVIVCSDAKPIYHFLDGRYFTGARITSKSKYNLTDDKSGIYYLHSKDTITRLHKSELIDLLGREIVE